MSLGRSLVRRGTLSFVLPAAAAAEAVAAMIEAKCGEMTLIPLWPHSGEAAKLVIVRGVREGKGGTTLHPGLVLHDRIGRLHERGERDPQKRCGATLVVVAVAQVPEALVCCDQALEGICAGSARAARRGGSASIRVF